MKFKKLEKGTTGMAGNKYKKWPWVSHLQFLDDSLSTRPTKSNIRESEAPSTETPDMETPTTNPTESVEESIVNNASSSSSQIPPASKRKNNNDSSEDLQKLITLIKKTAPNVNTTK